MNTETTHEETYVIDSADLRKLAKKRRSMAILEDIKENVLVELEEVKEKVSGYTSALDSLTSSLEEPEESVNGLAEWDAIPEVEQLKRLKAIDVFREAFQVGEEAPTMGLDEAVEMLSEKAEEYESIVDDRDYTADDREGVWGELQDALIEVADALDVMQGKTEEK